MRAALGEQREPLLRESRPERGVETSAGRAPSRRNWAMRAPCRLRGSTPALGCLPPVRRRCAARIRCPWNHVPAKWPHIRAALKRAGSEQAGRAKTISITEVDALPAPGAPPVRGFGLDDPRRCQRTIGRPLRRPRQLVEHGTEGRVIPGRPEDSGAGWHARTAGSVTVAGRPVLPKGRVNGDRPAPGQALNRALRNLIVAGRAKRSFIVSRELLLDQPPKGLRSLRQACRRLDRRSFCALPHPAG